MKCCSCFVVLFRKSKTRNVTPSIEIVIEDSRIDQSSGKRPLKEDASMSVSGMGLNAAEKKKVVQPKVRPKVYKLMKGTTSICHTPSLEKPFQRKVKVKKGVLRTPHSALLTSDVEAKKTLQRLRMERSHTQDYPNEDGIDTATNRPKVLF